MTLEELLPLLSRISATRRGIPLGELAAELGRSPSHTQRAFRNIVGESAKQFDKRLRLECGAAMLLTTTHTILDIALEAGFGSHEGFTRAFVGHFGHTPRAFRKRGAADSPDVRAVFAETVQHVGPCIGLFHAPASSETSRTTPPPNPAKTQTMSYDITQQDLPAQSVLVRKSSCEQVDIAKALADSLPSVFRYATESGIALSGPPFTRYLSWGPALVTIEAGMPVAAPSEGSGDIEAGELPACRAATTVHTGPYEGLGDAHAAVQRWIEENGLAPGCAPWEVYLTDPGEVPDPANWKTQIIWPLES